MPPKSPEDYLALLEDTKSAKRKSAAKGLGKTGDGSHGGRLLKALQKEVLDARTWQTQCALIRALADVDYEGAIPFLWEMAGSKHSATMLYHEIGFSLCRLHKTSCVDISVVRKIVETKNPMFASGAFMALYYLRIVPSCENDANYLLEAARGDTENEGRVITNRCYLAATVAEWKNPRVSNFLQWCSESEWQFLRDIVETVKGGDYPNWQPW